MWQYMTPGIPDEYFVRGNVPMTKEEIRILSISKLRLKEDSVIWDIGAGTGSVSVEAALISKRGVVYSIEKEEEGIKLINENVKNLTWKILLW
jgi:Met-10+ like-protein.